MVDYAPGTAAPAQVLPFQGLPSTTTPVTEAWLNHVHAVLADALSAGGRLADVEAGGGGTSPSPSLTDIYVANYVTTQSDTGRGAGLVAALAAIPAQGARVHLDALNYQLPAGQTAVATNLCHLQGVVGLDGTGTRVISTDTATTAVRLESNGSSVEAVSFIHGHAGTRAAGLIGLDIPNANFFRMDRAFFDGFSTNMRIGNGVYWSITDSAFRASVVSGLEIFNSQNGDAGDMTVAGCSFDKGSDTTVGGNAVLWRSGGGLRFVNNKINGSGLEYPFQYGLRIAVVDGAHTGIFVIADNSIENFTAAGVSITRAGTTGTIGLGVSTTDNIICPYRQNGSVGIQIDTVNPVGNMIDGNIIHDCSVGIDLNNVRQTTIGENTITGCYTTGLRLRSAVSGVQVHPQTLEMISGNGYVFDTGAGYRANQSVVLATGAALPTDVMPGAVIYRTP